MDHTARESLSAEAQTEGRGPGLMGAWRRRYVTPRLGAAMALWRLEAHLATPLALTLVAALGRWPAALAMGSIMAVFAFTFLVLLQGEPAVTELRQWAYQRPLVRRYLRPEASDPAIKQTILWAVAIPLVILLTGPFWRSVALLLLRAPRILAYGVGVLGSIPHALLWTGLVLGGLWEGLIWPILDRHWL